MGCWGMGLTQNDEFCDVYFALAKAEWMCCEQSQFILQKVKEIIESGANLDFYEELGADAKDLKLRKKKLSAFYESLQVPRKKPRKRYVDYDAYEKSFPPMDIGDCFAYKYGEGKRIVVILDWVRLPGFKEQVFCCILKNTYQASEVKQIDFLEQEIGHIGCYTGTEFLGKSNLQKVGKIDVPASAKNQILGVEVMCIDYKSDFKEDYSSKPALKLSKLLETRRVYKKMPDNQTVKAVTYSGTTISKDKKTFPTKIQCGDVFAIKDKEKYRIFVLTERKEMYFCTAIFGYAWRNIYDEIPSYEQLIKGEIIPLGWFKAETFPAIEELILVGNYPIFKELSLTFPEVINKSWKPAYNSLILRKNLLEEYPESLCMPLEQAFARVAEIKNDIYR